MHRTLEVFEHGTLHVGAKEGDLRELEFDALARFNETHRGEYFELGHRKIRFKNYVGYLEVGNLSVEILPKADRDGPSSKMVWRDGLLDMLRVALGLRLAQLPEAAQALKRSALLDLIAQAYLTELEPLLHEGLARGYRNDESNGSVFRGRLKVAANLRENIARNDRFFVEYQTFDHNIVVNRLLAAALHALSWSALSPAVSGKVDVALAQFPELQVAGVTSSMFDRLRLGRSTQRYERALTHARMILAQQGPKLERGRQRVFALLFDMNVLWERYVAALMRRAAPPGILVSTQTSHVFWKPHGRRERRVKPDIVIGTEEADRPRKTLLIIDTKWKVPSKGLPSDEDLKQMFVYNELLTSARSLLLYPKTSKSVSLNGTYSTKTHGCELFHVGLFDDTKWSNSKIRSQLCDLIYEACNLGTR